MAIEMVELPIDSMVIFHSYVNVYQRVTIVVGLINQRSHHWGTSSCVAHHLAGCILTNHKVSNKKYQHPTGWLIGIELIVGYHNPQ